MKRQKLPPLKDVKPIVEGRHGHWEYVRSDCRECKIDAETNLIKRLEEKSVEGMPEHEKNLHLTAIKDAYWRRRMLQRTPEEIERGVAAL